MNILIIQGPNLNLMGLKSIKVGEQVTLDKVNQGLRKQANKRPEEISLKILQSHKPYNLKTFTLKKPGRRSRESPAEICFKHLILILNL